MKLKIKKSEKEATLCQEDIITIDQTAVAGEWTAVAAADRGPVVARGEDQLVAFVEGKVL